MQTRDSNVAPSLAWGRHYAMVRPDHFRVDYAINPYMSPARQPDLRRAATQWGHLVDVVESCGARVDVLEQRPDSPDMVFAMNLGLALSDGGRARIAMSHMRYPQRRQETGSAAAWFDQAGFAPVYIGRDGIGPHLEAGDALPFAGSVVVGHGPRTEDLALKHLATEFGIAVRGVRLTHPGFYHLDLAFCPLDARHALVCPAAFDEASAESLLALVPEPLVLTEAEAMTFCANAIVIGRTVIMPVCPDRVRAQLEAWDFEVRVIDVSEFHKGGGSVRCLTNPLDINVGRDLAAVPGGDVLLPVD
ncbi:MAG: dimethylarginine dimethylaminohydrolase family protein [Nocardioidaceae bacterium]